MEYYQIYTLWSFHLFIKKLNINGLRNCRVYVQVCLLCPTWFGLLVLADTQPSLQTWPCEALFPCWWIGSHRYLSLSFFNLVGVSFLKNLYIPLLSSPQSSFKSFSPSRKKKLNVSLGRIFLQTKRQKEQWNVFEDSVHFKFAFLLLHFF